MNTKMKTLVFSIKIILFTVSMAFAGLNGIHVQAQIYVSVYGEGNQSGIDEDNTVSFNTFRSNLGNYLTNAEEGNQVFFKGGIYSVSTVINLTTYHVSFSALNPEDTVVFDGGNQNVRFVSTGKTFQAVNLSLRNFVTTSISRPLDGTTSLLTINANAKIEIDNCIIYNIESARNPLVTINGINGEFSVRNSLLEKISISKTSYIGDAYSVLEVHEQTGTTGGKYTFTNSTIKNWSVGSGLYSNIINLRHDNQTLILENCLVTQNTCGRSLIACYFTGTHITVTNCEFSENKSDQGNGLFFDTSYGTAQVGSMNITDCIFKNNKNTTSSSKPFIYLVNGELTVSGCTFSGNENISNIFSFTTGGTGNKLIYNNTFSGNAVTNTISLPANQSGNFFNNTIYNSGNINLSNGNYNVQNNLLISGSLAGTNVANARRNIVGNQFFASGNTNGSQLDSAIDTYVNTTLTSYEEGKPEIHDLIISGNVDNPILERGGNMKGTNYETYLQYDQKGKKRPENVSIGSIDLPVFGAMTGRYTILYNPNEGFEPYYEIDLSSYIISYPQGADKDNIQYEILAIPENGFLENGNSGYIKKFIPRKKENSEDPIDGIVGVPFDLIYKVKYTTAGITYIKEIKVKVTIININQPLGIVDETIIRCFTEMDEVEFKARYKFISASYGNRTINSGTDLEVSSFPNVAGTKYNGFSIPLVGDLDGDGKPEIVALGMNSGWVDLYQRGNALCILNGQSGKEIVRFALPVADWNLITDGYHSSPSNIALVDADRNGRAEIIVAIGNGGNSATNYRLISYEVNENTFMDREGGSDATNQNKLSFKWISNTSFVTSNANAARKPIPQIVDIDGDGIPEILVCHKIYNAENGREILTLDENYMGRDPEIGGGGGGDRYIPFAYIYDVDMDGKYDIAAGGKLYYDIDIHKTGAAPYYKTKIMNGIGDGHTAVADINADGIPDIIVSKGQAPHNLWVWDPGFFEKDGDDIKRVEIEKDPSVIAYQRSPVASVYTGTHSYIYVGDIDGRKDRFGNKLPEISLIGGRFFGNSAVPVHPNISKLGNNPFSLTTNGYIDYPGSQYPLISFTWDAEETDVNKKLKVSFILKHVDTSHNTGFTLFDFNNDGIQQICYRDMSTLRIISAAHKPFYDVTDTDVDLRTPVLSFTGYEYPVIADIDADGSADMIVMGQNQNDGQAYGYIYAVESTNGDFAPAPTVWNQYMYHPLKINEDLTTPVRTQNPLSNEFAYIKEEDLQSRKTTYIYNNTITQAVKSALFDRVIGEDTIQIIKPMVPTPDAKVEAEIVTTTPNRLTFRITNTGNATLNAATPIRIYRDSVHGTTRLTQIGNSSVPATLGTDIFVGDTLVLNFTSLQGAELAYTYICRITDPSPLTGAFTDKFMTEYDDCNWADNIAEVGTFVLKNDAATVVQYEDIIIDVFDNDILPEDFNKKLTKQMILEEPEAGSYEIINNKIRYMAPGRFDEGIIKIKYQLDYNGVKKSAFIYIYILQSEDEPFAVCEGTSRYSPELKYIPEEIVFGWSDKDGHYLGQEPPVLRDLRSDQTYFVKPDFSKVTDSEYIPYKLINFPAGELTIRVIPRGEALKTAKWKGTVDNDWYNPANWVVMGDNYEEYALKWAPNKCVHVIIDTHAPNYPELSEDASCSEIYMADRSMIAGIHHLDYDSAKVEIKLSGTELERFIMWSAPLKNMYSGDYHLEDKEGKPEWGSVYMNFFQSGNPDYPTSVAVNNAFTATFGHVGTLLPLGQAFNVKIDDRYSNANFIFPRTNDKYTDDNGKTYVLQRGIGRFVTDELNVLGEMDMPVNGNNEFNMIHVVNPFMAYLDIHKFLDKNSAVIDNNYKLWDGRLDHDFIDVYPIDSIHNRYVINASSMPNGNLTLIPPLQSFLVMKKTGVKEVNSLKITSSMATTINPEENSYLLRSTGNEEPILRVIAKQGDNESSTTLHYNENANPGFNGMEDARKLFNQESLVSVYTLSPSKDALAINSSSDYTQDIFLGIRLKKAGTFTLEFSGMKAFGHEVYLEDLEEKLLYDIGANPIIEFKTDSYSTGEYTELNNRFRMSFVNIDTGIDSMPEKGGLRITSSNGVLNVSSTVGEIKELQVYNLWGQLVYNSKKSNQFYKIPVESHQIYIVRGNINNRFEIIKAVAR